MRIAGGEFSATPIVEAPRSLNCLELEPIPWKYELRFMFMPKSQFVAGFVIWGAATVALRAWGQHVLRPEGWTTSLVFAASLPLMAMLARRLCKRLSPGERLRGAVALATPTLLFDPFSSAFFPVVFPNIAPQMAGVFGGWMLWCCAGALLGARPWARD